MDGLQTMSMKSKTTFSAVAFIATVSSQAMAVSIPKEASLDIFLQPSNAIVQHIKSESRQLKNLGETTFYEQGYPPHITLYLTNYPVSALPEIKRIVKDIANHQYAFPLESIGTSITKSHWVFVNIKDSNPLQSLSDRIAQRLSPLHSKSMPEPTWVELYPEKEAFVKKYGSPNVFSQFQPHITLLANGNKQAVAKYYKRYNENTKTMKDTYGHGIAIGIGYTNKYGQMTKVVAKYPLLSKSAIRSKK